MDDQNALVERVHEVYPDLAIETIQMNSQGWSNQVLVINGHLIFRFPRNEQALAEMAIELTILQGLQNYVTLAVPNPQYYQLLPRVVGQVFMGYAMIPGEPLWRDTFAASDDLTHDCLARELGTFLRELHALPVSHAIKLDLPHVGRSREEWIALHEHMQGALFPRMMLDARRRAVRHFDAFLSEVSNFTYHPCLSHRDFATSNILVRGEPLHVSGIIDFGRAGLADPASDFAGILYGYGEPFLRRFLAVYPEIEAAFARARFYNESFALQTALSAAERRDEDLLKRSLEWYDAVSPD